MTEAEWFTAGVPMLLLDSLRDKTGERKLWLLDHA